MDIINRYWFTDDDGENVLNDFIGTYDEAINVAEMAAKKLNCDIFLNFDNDILYVAFKVES